jgi:competence ComEA-like helix-hairpin-helix protein
MLAIACSLLAMVAYRHSAANQSRKALEPVACPAVIIELAAAGKSTGIYFFSPNADTETICAAMNIDTELLGETDVENLSSIATGTAVVIADKGVGSLISVVPIAAEKRIALGIPLDLNAATVAELTYVPGIGPGLASALVKYRCTHGAFSRVEDITEVKGIGSKRLRSARKYLMVNSER